MMASKAKIEARLDHDNDGFQGAFGLTADKKTRTAGHAKSGTGSTSKRTRNPDQHVANALRSAYEEAIQEDVPPEFLDLLGKLS